eukprot:12654252-Alexandrium_andersonii.AAC.1
MERRARKDQLAARLLAGCHVVSNVRDEQELGKEGALAQAGYGLPQFFLGEHLEAIGDDLGGEVLVGTLQLNDVPGVLAHDQ